MKHGTPRPLSLGSRRQTRDASWRMQQSEMLRRTVGNGKWKIMQYKMRLTQKDDHGDYWGIEKESNAAT